MSWALLQAEGYRELCTVLERPYPLLLLLNHLLAKDQVHVLLFVLEVRRYQQHSSVEVASDILQIYLDEGAPLQVEVCGSDTATTIEGRMRTLAAEDAQWDTLFDVPAEAAFSYLKDALAKFTNSPDLPTDWLSIMAASETGMTEAHYTHARQTVWGAVECMLGGWMADMRANRMRVLLLVLADLIGCILNLPLEALAKFKYAQKTGPVVKRPTYPTVGKKTIIIGTHRMVHTLFVNPGHCDCCQGLLWGVGHQGWQCAECGTAIHRWERCMNLPPCEGPGKGAADMMRATMSRTLRTIKQRPAVQPDGAPPAATPPHEAAADQHASSAPTPHSPAALRGHPTSPQAQRDRTKSAAAVSAALRDYLKQAEGIKGSWAESVSKDVSKRLDKKEVKRQEIIFELVQTERNYVLDLITLKEVFQDPLREMCLIPSDTLTSIFSNLDDLVAVSARFCRRMLCRQAEAPIIATIGDLFDKEFECFKVYTTFCANNIVASDELANLKKKSKEFERFIQDAEAHPRCHRLTLDSFLASAMQRLTRYPLLLTSIANQTPPTHPDYALLTNQALPTVRSVCDHVNQRVDMVSNTYRLARIRASLDTALNLDLYDAPRRVVHEGSLEVKMALSTDKALDKKKKRPVHAVILSDQLILGTMKAERLSVDIEPIPLYNVLVKDVAGSGGDKKSFFLISTVGGTAHMHELSAYSVAEKKNWIAVINDTSNRCRHTMHPVNSALAKNAALREQAAEEQTADAQPEPPADPQIPPVSGSQEPPQHKVSRVHFDVPDSEANSTSEMIECDPQGNSVPPTADPPTSTSELPNAETLSPPPDANSMPLGDGARSGPQSDAQCSQAENTPLDCSGPQVEKKKWTDSCISDLRDGATQKTSCMVDECMADTPGGDVDTRGRGGFSPAELSGPSNSTCVVETANGEENANNGEGENIQNAKDAQEGTEDLSLGSVVLGAV